MPTNNDTKQTKNNRYIEAVGRRKTSVARVRITETSAQKPAFVVNDKSGAEYFPTDDMRVRMREPMQKVKAAGRFDVSVHVKGGGLHAQSEALRHGLARALTSFNEEWRSKLKKAGLLKRDPRMKERKKFGLKKARKAPQWSKR